MKDVENLRQHFEFLKEVFEAEVGFEELEELDYQIEMEMMAIDDMRLESFKNLSKLRNELRTYIEENTKKEENHYDPEAELDRLIPDRHDDDFDEEDLSSWDSIIGDD